MSLCLPLGTVEPAALPVGVVCRFPLCCRMMAARAVEHHLIGVLGLLLPRLLLAVPWLLSGVLLPRLGPLLLTLAITGILVANSCHLIGSILVSRPVILPLIPEILAIIAPISSWCIIRLIPSAWLCRHQRWLCRVTESVHIGDLDGFCQSCRHLSLQLLPEHAAMSTSLRKPSNGLRLHNTLARVAKVTPSCQIIPICFIEPLLAHGQLLGPVWPLVGAGEVADESIFKIEPAIYAVLGQVIEPDPCWTLQHLRYIPHSPTAIPAVGVH